jgi:hypothetical protein
MQGLLGIRTLGGGPVCLIGDCLCLGDFGRFICDVNAAEDHEERQKRISKLAQNSEARKQSNKQKNDKSQMQILSRSRLMVRGKSVALERTVGLIRVWW